MTHLRDTNRRTVLKTIGAGAVGSIALSTPVAAHGGGGRDQRLPSWFETQLWEMAERPPVGQEPTDHHSHAPIWQIAPDAGDQGCAQIPGILDFGPFAEAAPFLAEDGSWAADYDGEGNLIPGSGPYMDHTLSANPFSPIWHVHFVFDKTASFPYSQSDLVNVDHNDDPLTSGSRIRNATNVVIESVPFVFNCPIRPNNGDHYIRTLCRS